MPRIAVLPRYRPTVDSPSRSPPCSPSSSPRAGISSRSASPSSPRSPLSASRHSAFSLVCPRDFHPKDYLSVRGIYILASIFLCLILVRYRNGSFRVQQPSDTPWIYTLHLAAYSWNFLTLLPNSETT